GARCNYAVKALIDRGNERRTKHRTRIAGECIALRFGQIGVGIAQVEREDLPGEAEPHVPSVVVSILDAIREQRVSVEGVAGTEPLMAELTRQVPAERAKGHLLRRRVLDGAGQIFAVRAEVQEVRRPVEIRAERPIGPSVSDLAVDFVEAGDRLRNVPGREKGRTAGSRQRGDAPRRSVTRAARVIIFPKTDVEDDRAPRQAHPPAEIAFTTTLI